MDDLKNKILEYEEKFEALKTVNEKKHLVYIIFYFFSTIAFAYAYHKHFNSYYFIKIALFSYMILGLSIHYFLRFKLQKSGNRYKKIFNELFSELLAQEKNQKILFDNIKKISADILNERKIDPNKNSLRYYPFWELLFLNINHRQTGQR